MAAGGRRIRRLIELILDTAAAKRAELAMQQSLRRGTDPNVPTRQLGMIDKGLARLRLSALALASALLGAVALGFRKIVRESSEAQAVQAQLAAALESTGHAAGRSAEQLNAHAEALSKVTTFSDEAIGSAQALLLTFRQIRGNRFDQATEAVLDLAQAMGGGEGGLRAASLQLGKALNDPVKGIAALRRVGIQFTESQEDLIKNLAETNRLAEAQGVILKEVGVQFGGSARAARETLGGALQGLNNAWANAFEVSKAASAGIVGFINDMAEAVPAVRQRLDSFFLRIQELGINAAVNWERLRVLFRTVIRDWAVAQGAPQSTIDALNASIESARVGLVRMEESAVEMMAELYKPPDRPSPFLPLADEAGEAADEIERLNAAEERRQLLEREAPRRQFGLEEPGIGLGPLRLPGEEIGRETTDVFAAQTQAIVEQLSSVQSAAEITAFGIESAFQDAFSLLGAEGENLGSFLEAMFRGVASSAISGLAEYATTKVAENVAAAFEEYAKGTAALANPFLAATAPLHFAAAKGHGIAALKWAAFGGVAAAASSAVAGGGGGGGSSYRGSDVTGRAVDRLDNAAPIVNVYVDGFDPDNPRHVEKFQRGVINARQQWNDQKPTARQYRRSG